MKKLQALIAITILIVMIIFIDQFSASFILNDSTASEIDNYVYPHEQVIDVNIQIDTDTYTEMIANAMSEEYVMADITYNGYTFNNVAIRPKGNSSLRDVAQSGGTRLSFKVDLDKYIDGQNLFGITKLNLNNLFQDETLMKEYISYDMLDSIEAIAPDTTYVSLSINGEFFGLYLSVEEVNETFLMENFGNYDGELYKPDVGIGADLAYISDDPEDYEGVVPQDDDMETDANFVELVKVIDKIIENGGETDEYQLSDVLNVDSFLKYLAFSTAVVHMDSYQSGMFHNYYLYYNTDTELFEWITWDLNMAFNGFPMSGLTDEEATQFLIDEPVIGAMSGYPLVEAAFTNTEYVKIYHDYIQELIDGYLDITNFENVVTSTFSMIESYASIDPSAFFELDTVKTNVFDSSSTSTISLLEFVELRAENMQDQLDGLIVSTNDGKGNSGSQSMGQKGGQPNQGGEQIPGDATAEGVQLDGAEVSNKPTAPADGAEVSNKPAAPADGEETSNMPAAPADGAEVAVGTRPGPAVATGSEAIDVEFSIEMLPPVILALYESGELPDEITEYLDKGEAPPKDLMDAFMVESGISTQVGNQNQPPSDVAGGVSGNETSNPGNLTGDVTTESVMTTQEIINTLIPIGGSLAVAVVLLLYLVFRKY
ncbi:CotH kinase family protein [Fusibacter bizertensis]|uniref:CotH kinase family protein n=1 Tax=Fusibacter bizertensis TaxID=1488331 RepID=A0ABT6NCF4_9FIRM|nr:CotH kinase family protein [Fusibacter bizertensis]MDH8678105.1 CotH kinase family protein [Fusibacter bizertensis]